MPGRRFSASAQIHALIGLSNADDVLMIAHDLKGQSWNGPKFACREQTNTTKGLPDGRCSRIWQAAKL